MCRMWGVFVRSFQGLAGDPGQVPKEKEGQAMGYVTDQPQAQVVAEIR